VEGGAPEIERSTPKDAPALRLTRPLPGPLPAAVESAAAVMGTRKGVLDVSGVRLRV